MNKPFTENQTALGHAIEAVIVAIIMAVLTAVGEYLSSGKFSLTGLFIVVGAAFSGALLKGWFTLRSNPKAIPALVDTINQVSEQFGASHNQILSALMQILSILPAPGQQQQPVVVNLAQPKAEQPVTIGTENVSSAPQSSQQPPQSQHAVSNQPTSNLPSQPQVMMSAPSQPPQMPFPDPSQSRHFGDTGVVPVAALSQQQQQRPQ